MKPIIGFRHGSAPASAHIMIYAHPCMEPGTLPTARPPGRILARCGPIVVAAELPMLAGSGDARARSAGSEMRARSDASARLCCAFGRVACVWME